jgi:hypothetical protein
VKKAIWVLWPSFLVAGAAEVLFFSVFDPADFRLFGMSRTAGYSIGFFLFWALAAASSGFTCFLQRTADEINRCPLVPAQRPAGCPKRVDPGAAC